MASLIGPSGCGKSTLLRTINRVNERLGYVRTTGAIDVLGTDIFGPEIELARLRKDVGMVFQRPNPLPISIRDNVLFGYRIHGEGRRRIRNEERRPPAVPPPAGHWPGQDWPAGGF